VTEVGQRPLIVGCGLIGTSLGLALARIGVVARLHDVRPDHVAQAVAVGAGVAWQPDSDVETDIDLVVVAVPPGQTQAVLAQFGAICENATLTDVASVKAPVIHQAPAIAQRLVPGHPMAGRELSGPQAARADLFDDRLWILTPTADSETARVDQLRAFVRRVGAVTVVMSVDEHDEAVALISHVPQVLASVLAGQLLTADTDHVAIAGQGLRDMTRIASSNVELWTDILAANADPIQGILGDIEGQLAQVRSVLAGDRHGISAILQAGVDGQKRIPGKHGAFESPYVEIPVMVEDRPGQLAALLVAAGEADINLEDVRIEHVLGRPSGLIELSVRPEHGERLVDVLRTRGFDVRI
jgi:prephenate dehydrogenase